MSSAPWYNPNYLLRRGVRITSPDGAPAGHFVQYKLASASKSLQPNNTDILVVYGSDAATPIEQVLPRSVTTNPDGSLTVQWNLVNALGPNVADPGSYYVYEGCSVAANVVSPASSYSYEAWPVQESVNGPNITYTRPGDYWVNGVTNRPGAMARISFYGTSVQVSAAVGPQYGKMQVQLDGQSPQVVDLYALYEGIRVVYQAENLNSSYHIITLTCMGQANPASSGSTISLRGVNLVKYLDVQDLGEEIYPIVWSSYVGG